jgi:DNA polymerase
VVDVRSSLDALRDRARACRDCDLWEHATQTVFGEGPPDAAMVLIGEQPGDKEDLAGHPFVGPAGRVLDDALDAAGIARDEVYLTNAVKHFKWKAVPGKPRLHQKPNASEVRACTQWWEKELAVLRPDVTVLLGATAAQAVLGPKVRVTRDRGQVQHPAELASPVVVTVHPSAVLRADAEARRESFAWLVSDLELALSVVAGRRRVHR